MLSISALFPPTTLFITIVKEQLKKTSRVEGGGLGHFFLRWNNIASFVFKKKKLSSTKPYHQTLYAANPAFFIEISLISLIVDLKMCPKPPPLKVSGVE
jgi:hypothetical protein